MIWDTFRKVFGFVEKLLILQDSKRVGGGHTFFSPHGVRLKQYELQ